MLRVLAVFFRLASFGFLLCAAALSGCSSEHGTCGPKTCQSIGANCGQVSDGCGGALECGGCSAPEVCGGGGVANACGMGLPPDPATLAPQLNGTTPTDFAASLEFLYSGDRPIQLGVKPETIESHRAALVRGRVKAVDGSALPGVAVDVLGHPELGNTLTRADGMFDLVVNGGGQLVLRYSKAGLLPAQRQVQAPWRGAVWANPVVLIPQDDAVTTIELGAASAQAAQSSEFHDDKGSRRATLIVLPGTTAHLRMPDGATAPLSLIHVRGTEHTVGDDGPSRMPADLPPQSAYTYAVAWSVDEAQAAGAASVEFSRPVISYVDNFLGFPEGTGIPAGYYDPAQGQWLAIPNGKVIKILALNGGGVDLDADGDGNPDSLEALQAAGITDAERGQLARLFQAGQVLWRVAVPHFSLWDFNSTPVCKMDGNSKCLPPAGGPADLRRRLLPIAVRGLDHPLPGPGAWRARTRGRHALSPRVLERPRQEERALAEDHRERPGPDAQVFAGDSRDHRSSGPAMDEGVLALAKSELRLRVGREGRLWPNPPRSAAGAPGGRQRL
jgi:hypothetical protein